MKIENALSTQSGPVMRRVALVRLTRMRGMCVGGEHRQAIVGSHVVGLEVDRLLDLGEVVLDEFVALRVRDVGVGFAVVPAAVLAEERQVHAARHVRRGHERADEADDQEQLEAVLLRVHEDLVLRPEPGEREDAAQRDRADDERPERLRHVLPQAAHVLLHVEGVVRARVAHRAGAEEEVGLEERVREEVEDRRDPRADAERHDHVAELADRRVREHLLDVVLDEGRARHR